MIERPKQNLGDVSSHLQDVAITTFAVCPHQLQKHISSDVSPQLFSLNNGQTKALVSAVTFLNTRFFVGFAPFVRLQCHQTNYRAYVQYRGKEAVWFLGTFLNSFWTFIPQKIWGLPWYRSKTTHKTRWKNDSIEYDWHSKTKHWYEGLSIHGKTTPFDILDGFSDIETCSRILTHPVDGYLYMHNKYVGHYSVWHEKMNVRQANATKTRFTFLEELGLIKDNHPPHSVLVQELIHYLIFLPPQKVVPSFQSLK